MFIVAPNLQCVYVFHGIYISADKTLFVRSFRNLLMVI